MPAKKVEEPVVPQPAEINGGKICCNILMNMALFLVFYSLITGGTLLIVYGINFGAGIICAAIPVFIFYLCVLPAEEKREDTPEIIMTATDFSKNFTKAIENPPTSFMGKLCIHKDIEKSSWYDGFNFEEWEERSLPASSI